MTEPNGWLRLACIVAAIVFLSVLQQMGPLGLSMAISLGAVGLGNAMASDFTRWWHPRT